MIKNDFGQTGIDDHFTAEQAGGKGGVKGGSLDVDAVIGRLGNRVFFGVGAQTFLQL